MSHDTITELDARVGVMFQEVLRRTHLSAPEDLGRVVAEEARRIGVDSLVVYVVDYEQRTLVPVPAPDAHASGPLSIQGTVAGRAFASTAILDVEGDAGEGRRLWLPLLDGTERIGVLRLTIAGGDPVPEPLRGRVRALRPLHRAVGGEQERVHGLLRAAAPHRRR